MDVIRPNAFRPDDRDHGITDEHTAPADCVAGAVQRGNNVGTHACRVLSRTAGARRSLNHALGGFLAHHQHENLERTSPSLNGKEGVIGSSPVLGFAWSQQPEGECLIR